MPERFAFSNGPSDVGPCLQLRQHLVRRHVERFSRNMPPTIMSAHSMFEIGFRS
jgi:hypothetical protein